MDNKEIKTNTNELNDEELENVSGGEYQRLLKPIILDNRPCWKIYCVGCGKEKIVPQQTYEDMMAYGGYCCDDCKAKTAENNP